MAEPDETFLLVDGENIDATLGASLAGRRPAPEERPRWDRVRDHALRANPTPGRSWARRPGRAPGRAARPGRWRRGSGRGARAPRRARTSPASRGARRGS